jgi:hypothetical protein
MSGISTPRAYNGGYQAGASARAARASDASINEEKREKVINKMRWVATLIVAVAVICIVFPKLIAYPIALGLAVVAYDLYKIASNLKALKVVNEGPEIGTLLTQDTVIAKRVLAWGQKTFPGVFV